MLAAACVRKRALHFPSLHISAARLPSRPVARPMPFCTSAPSAPSAIPRKPPPLANALVDPPPDAYRSRSARVPIRKPENHVPAVQRWSAILPDELVVGTFGVQSLAPDELGSGAFMRWASDALTPSFSSSSQPTSLSGSSSSFAPVTADHARHTDEAGYTHHVVVAYWRDPGAYERWAEANDGWWSSSDRDREDGVYREVVRVPRDRAESIYWLDYPGGLMRDTRTELYPTPYCGYYGAMRDRLSAAGDDSLDGAAAPPERYSDRSGRWKVTLPHNVAVIRSAHTWQFMDEEQLADYGRKLKPPLSKGMDFLATKRESGCLSLRWLTSTEADGSERPEAHATAYFTSLRHMEDWAERHRTHAAIFGAAVARYKHYGGENQLRTWHEVFVLPQGQVFEYINCHPETGLLPYFDGEKVR